MRVAIPRHRVIRSVALGAIAGLPTIAACNAEGAGGPPAEVSTVGIAARSPVFMAPGTAYMEFQVESPVTPAAGTSAPRYPDALRKAGVEGEVLASFVVGETGQVEPGSLEVLKSSDDLFTQAVARALPQMRFNPARVGGKAVRQIVQQPFTFSLGR